MTIDIFFTLNNRFNLGVSTKRSVAKEADQKQEKKNKSFMIWPDEFYRFLSWNPEFSFKYIR